MLAGRSMQSAPCEAAAAVESGLCSRRSSKLLVMLVGRLSSLKRFFDWRIVNESPPRAVTFEATASFEFVTSRN